jgi:hypothetical protein
VPSRLECGLRPSFLLFRDCQVVLTVDHRLALSKPALPSAPSKKLISALGAFYRRLSARIGKAKAVTATARKIAVLFYNAVRHGMEYVDPGASFYETRYRTRVVNNLHRRAKAFGFVLQPMEPTPGVVVS